MEEMIVPGIPNTEQLIIVRQLPIIEERLREKAEDIKARTQMACSMACTPETVIEVKKVRAALNKEFGEYEQARKAVKKAVLAPYDSFEEKYKTYISDEFGKADKQLKHMVDNVEYHLRDTKEKALRLYYAEHLAAAGLNAADWNFERTGIQVILSKSDKSLKAALKGWIEARTSEMRTIESMEHADEIMVEYKRSINLSEAILVVKDRHKAIEEAQAQREARETVTPPVVEEVSQAPVVEALAPPVIEPVAAVMDDEPVFKLSFSVYGTKPQLRALKQFLNDGGYTYE